MNIKYTDLKSTNERGAVCEDCREYKGMVDCPECFDSPFCIFCCDGVTVCCGEVIHF